MSAIYRKWKKDQSYLSDSKKILTAAGSKSLRELFVSVGIDITDENFWNECLDELEEQIKKL